MEEKLASLLWRQTPRILCPSDRKVTRMCINPKCSVSLRCESPICQSCGISVHQDCPQAISLQQVTAKLNEKLYQWKPVLSNIMRVEEQLVRQIQRNQITFMQKIIEDRLSEANLGNIYRALFKNKNYRGVNGNNGFGWINVLERKTTIPFEGEKQKLDKYRKQLARQMKVLVSMRQYFFLKQKVPNFLCRLRKNESLYDSVVLKLKGNVADDVQFINDSLNFPSSAQLLFRASQHNFSAHKFHKYCDNVLDTLVLVRTQFGKTLVGYSDYRWWSRKYGYVSDCNRRTFLFQLDLRLKLVPQQDFALIYSHKDWGPNFGGGALFLCNNCHLTAESSILCVGETYNCEGPEKFSPESQETWTAMSGAPVGNTFRVIEYEVFRVNWNSQNRTMFEDQFQMSRIKVESTKPKSKIKMRSKKSIEYL